MHEAHSPSSAVQLLQREWSTKKTETMSRSRTAETACTVLDHLNAPPSDRRFTLRLLNLGDLAAITSPQHTKNQTHTPNQTKKTFLFWIGCLGEKWQSCQQMFQTFLPLQNSNTQTHTHTDTQTHTLTQTQTHTQTHTHTQTQTHTLKASDALRSTPRLVALSFLDQQPFLNSPETQHSRNRTHNPYESQALPLLLRSCAHSMQSPLRTWFGYFLLPFPCSTFFLFLFFPLVLIFSMRRSTVFLFFFLCVWVCAFLVSASKYFPCLSVSPPSQCLNILFLAAFVVAVVLLQGTCGHRQHCQPFKQAFGHTATSKGAVQKQPSFAAKQLASSHFPTLLHPPLSFPSPSVAAWNNREPHAPSCRRLKCGEGAGGNLQVSLRCTLQVKFVAKNKTEQKGGGGSG